MQPSLSWPILRGDRLKFCVEYKWDHGGDIKMQKKKKKKKTVTILGNDDGLKIYVNPSKIYIDPGI